MPRFACPTCNTVFEVAPEHVGMTVRCPSCSATLGTSAGGATPPRPSTAGGEGGFASPPVPGPGGAGPQFGGPQGYYPSQPPATYFPGQPGGPVAPGGPGMAGQYPYPYGYGPTYMMPPQRGPNPAGAWSFALSIAFVVLFFGMVVSLMHGVDTSSEEAMHDWAESLQSNPPAWLGPAGIGLFLLAGAAVVIGLYAVTRPNRRKGLAIAGLIISGLSLVCGILSVVGNLAGKG